MDADLSQPARRLLDLLRTRAHRRELAIPDHRLAELLGVDERKVIELSDDILVYGWTVVAETSRPCGRWLIVDPADLPAGERYLQVLRHRAKLAFVRARHVRQSIEATSIRLRSAPAQGWLFGPEPAVATGPGFHLAPAKS